MIKSSDDIGIYAGQMWQNLNENGNLTQQELVRRTNMKNNEFHLAVGWLARENKINTSMETNTYSLGETNLNDEIGGKAGVVYNILKDESKKGIASIAKSANLRPREVYSALGWLAREDKIDIFHTSNNQLKYSVKE